MQSSQFILRAEHSTNARCLSIWLRIGRRADRARIFNAMTLGEYIELWASDHGTRNVTCNSDPTVNGKFYLEISEAQSKNTIDGTIDHYDPLNKVVFSWRHLLDGSAGDSTVTIQLLPRKSGLILSILHTGLGGVEEYQYFLALWTGCIAWLSLLFCPAGRLVARA